jgi:hypothetical protein
MQPQAKESLESPKHGRDKEGLSFRVFGEIIVLGTL